MRSRSLLTILLRTAAVLAVLLFSVALTVGIGLYTTVYPEKFESGIQPRDLGFEYEDVTLTTEDGLHIAGWYIPKEGTPTDSVVIVLHGYPTEKGDLLQRSAFLREDHDLFLIDFRHFGASEGDHTTLGLTEVKDLSAAVRYVREERGKKKVGVYGFSMGAAVALESVGRVDGIDAVVAEASYADLTLMAEEIYRSFGPLKKEFAGLTVWTAKTFLGVDVEQISPVRSVRGTEAPILLIHSRGDQVVPFIHAEMLKEALVNDPNAEFEFGDELLHGQASVEYVSKMKRFFKEYLNPNMG